MIFLNILWLPTNPIPIAPTPDLRSRPPFFSRSEEETCVGSRAQGEGKANFGSAAPFVVRRRLFLSEEAAADPSFLLYVSI